jgi:aconitate hydratase
VDAETLRYLRLTGRSEEQIALVEAYYKEQGTVPHRRFAGSRIHADARARSRHVEPSVAGPKRPQDRVLLKDAAEKALRSSCRRCWPHGEGWERAGRWA